MRSGRIQSQVAISTVAILVVVVISIVIAGVVFLNDLQPRESSSSSTSTISSPQTQQLNSTLTLSSFKSQGKVLIEVSFPGILIASPHLSWMNYSATFSSIGNVPSNLSLSLVTPPELEARFSQDTVSLGSNQSSATLQLATMATLGIYQFTIVATGNGSTFRANETIEILKYLVVTVGTSFIPQNLTVSQGSTVTWLRLNGALSPSDNGAHDVDFSSGISFVSPTLSQYESWNYTFSQIGSYSYYCKYHPFMTGEITVVPTS